MIASELSSKQKRSLILFVFAYDKRKQHLRREDERNYTNE